MEVPAAVPQTNQDITSGWRTHVAHVLQEFISSRANRGVGIPSACLTEPISRTISHHQEPTRRCRQHLSPSSGVIPGTLRKPVEEKSSPFSSWGQYLLRFKKKKRWEKEVNNVSYIFTLHTNECLFTFKALLYVILQDQKEGRNLKNWLTLQLQTRNYLFYPNKWMEIKKIFEASWRRALRRIKWCANF